MSMPIRGLSALLWALVFAGAQVVCASEPMTNAEVSAVTEQYWRTRLFPWPHQFEWLGRTPADADELVLVAPVERSDVLDEAVGNICAAVTRLCGRPPAVATSTPEEPGFILRLGVGRTGGTAIPPQADKAQGYYIEPFEAEQSHGLALWGHDPAGAFYAIQTLRQLMETDENGRLIMPRVRIADAPDLRDRGYFLDGRREPKTWDLAGWKKHIDWAASHRFNTILVLVTSGGSRLLYHSAAFPEQVRRSYPLAEPGVLRAVVEYGRRKAVRIVPTIPHLDFLTELWKDYRDAMMSIKGRRSFGGTITEDRRAVDFRRPEALEVLTRLIVDVVSASGADELSVWPVEDLWATHEDILAQVAALCNAWDAARRQVSEPLTLRMLTTPTTFPVSEEMFRILPRNVKVDYYGGMATYTLAGMRFNDATIHVLQRGGFHFTTMPAYGRLFWDGVPLAFPALCRDNAIASAKRGACGVVANGGDQPTAFAVNYAAGAEFAWNLRGRNVSDFLRAWAHVNSLPQPENVAAFYGHLEKASIRLCLAHHEHFQAHRATIAAWIDEPAKGDPAKRRRQFIEPLKEALAHARAAAELAEAVGVHRLKTEAEVMRSLAGGILNLHEAIAARESARGYESYRAHLEAALEEFSRLEEVWPELQRLNPGTVPQDPATPYRREIAELLADDE